MSRMDAKEKRRIVEALILSSAEPISAAKLAEVIPYCNGGQAKDLVNELNTEYVEQDRSFEIWEVAGGFQIRTRAEFSGYLQKLQKERALRLSQAALETMAIIAYRQPVTRAEIEEVRGVDAGATVKSLLDRHLIRIAGQREVPGRPMLYGTTRRFLEVFGLERLKDLPNLRELDDLAREQGLVEKVNESAVEGLEDAEAASVEAANVEAADVAEPIDGGDAEGVEDAKAAAGDVTDGVAAAAGVEADLGGSEDASILEREAPEAERDSAPEDPEETEDR